MVVSLYGKERGVPFRLTHPTTDIMKTDTLEAALLEQAKIKVQLKELDRIVAAFKPAPTGLSIETYSMARPGCPRSFVVRGTTPDHAEDMKLLGGVFNRRLKGGLGWIFREVDRPMVEDWILTQSLLPSQGGA